MTEMSVSVLDETPVFSGLRREHRRKGEIPFAGVTEIWPTERSTPDIRFDDFATIPASGVTHDLKILSRTIQQTYGSVDVSPTTVAHYYLWLREMAAGLLATAPDADDLGVVDAVHSLTNRLGVTQRVVFEATEIKKRSFHHWKRHPEAMPRAGSLGSLWALVSATDDLEDHLGAKPVAVWLRERPERLAALKAGHFRRVVDAATGVLAIDPQAVAHRREQMVDEGAFVDDTSSTKTEVTSLALDADEPPKVVLD